MNQPNQPVNPVQVGGARPRELTGQEQAAATVPNDILSGEVKVLPPLQGQGIPTLMPRSASVAGAAGTTWHSNVHISDLWSMNQDRNAWVYIANVGWVKLSNASESGTVALSLLAAFAKQSQETVTCRQEADGMIHEIYA